MGMTPLGGSHMNSVAPPTVWSADKLLRSALEDFGKDDGFLKR